MDRTVSNWDDAAADAYTYLNERSREFPKQSMWAFIDDFALRGSATQAEMVEKHGHVDFVATTLGHVTTAVHARGPVPKNGGWYRVTTNPHTYHIHPAFAAAWKLRRRLPRT